MRKNKKGFTLVELVIVIAVIAILAAVLLPTFAGIVQRARFSSVVQRAEAVRKEVLGQYFDTSADMGGVTVYVQNDGKVYGFVISNETTTKGQWEATDMTTTESNGTGKKVDGSTTTTKNFYKTYGNDAVVEIPVSAHFGTNVTPSTTSVVDTDPASACVEKVPLGLTQKTA